MGQQLTDVHSSLKSEHQVIVQEQQSQKGRIDALEHRFDRLEQHLGMTVGESAPPAAAVSLLPPPPIDGSSQSLPPPSTPLRSIIIPPRRRRDVEEDEEEER